MQTEATESSRPAQAILLAEAEECFAQAGLLYAATPDARSEALALDGLVTVQTLRNKFGDAQRACMEACDIYDTLGQLTSLVSRNALELLQDCRICSPNCHHPIF